MCRGDVEHGSNLEMYFEMFYWIPDVKKITWRIPKLPTMPLMNWKLFFSRIMQSTFSTCVNTDNTHNIYLHFVECISIAFHPLRKWFIFDVKTSLSSCCEKRISVDIFSAAIITHIMHASCVHRWEIYCSILRTSFAIFKADSLTTCCCSLCIMLSCWRSKLFRAWRW